METQQFHLKWNNHSLNTLSSFQHLLDTNTLVDVSLTCSNGKTVTAHRMVLAACSDYFYRLFKDLPEKHPVIVFKDAGEEIVRDLLLFMYRGEVEVQEAYLNDFLKFADTLQVKGLSQSDREEQAKNNNNNNNNSIRKDTGGPLSLVKTTTTTPHPASSIASAVSGNGGGTIGQQPPMSDLAKSYLAGLTKFPPIFPHLPTEPMATSAAAAMGAAGNPAAHADLFGGLASPNLYRALQRKYPDNPVLLKQMPFLKKMFGDNPDFMSSLYPLPPHHSNDDSDGGDRSSPPPSMPSSHRPPLSRTPNSENGMDRPLGADSPYPPSSGGPGSASGDHTPEKEGKGSIGGSKNSGRGSRLERMIAAEYKIMNEFSDQPPEMLPVMTPELMKSRRTHSLQLAIAEIMHNRASVQSAATKYHIPRETLRRHYQRYLKAMGIQKKVEPAKGGGGGGGAGGSLSGSTTPTSNTPSSTISNNNNTKAGSGMTTPNLPFPLPPPPGLHGFPGALAAAAAAAAAAANNSEDGGSNGFSSLMEIGAAYGIWNPDVDSFKNKKMRMDKEAMAINEAASMSLAAQAADRLNQASADKEDKEKLVIDEDEEEEEEEEPLSPGGPEDQPPQTGEAMQIGERDHTSAAASISENSNKPSATSAAAAPMETSA